MRVSGALGRARVQTHLEDLSENAEHEYEALRIHLSPRWEHQRVASHLVPTAARQTLAPRSMPESLPFRSPLCLLDSGARSSTHSMYSGQPVVTESTVTIQCETSFAVRQSVGSENEVLFAMMSDSVVYMLVWNLLNTDMEETNR